MKLIKLGALSCLAIMVFNNKETKSIVDMFLIELRGNEPVLNKSREVIPL